MAEFKTVEETKTYQLSNGDTADLIALIGNDTPAEWVPASKETAPVGTVAYAYAMGRDRRGVVVKHTPTKIQVAITTQGAVDTATHPEYYNNQVRIQIVSVPTADARIAPPAAQPVVETEQERAEKLNTVDAHEAAIAEDAERAACGQVRTWMERHDVDSTDGIRQAEEADHAEAVRENWCRRQVDLAGESWSTHFAKFDGTVLPRELTLNSQGCKVGLVSEEDRTEEPDMSSKAMQEAKALKTATQIREKAAETETQKHTGSTVVALIERVWDRIREDHPELPEVVVTTGSGEGVKWGHFRPESWKVAEAEGRMHEFFLSSEALAKGSVQVLQTTIHEATHTLNRVRGIKDTSRQHRYHNAQFRKTAEELGLEHPGAQADATHGFSFVKLSEATKVKHADLLAELDKELVLTGILPLWLGGSADGEDEQGGEKITGKPAKGKGESQSGNQRAVCQCEEPNIIRASQKMLDLAVIRCDDCESLFTASQAK